MVHATDVIYIPEPEEEYFRSLVRLRSSLRRNVSCTQNRIKSHLCYYGVSQKFLLDSSSHWSRKAIRELEEQEYLPAEAKQTLALLLKQLFSERQLLSETLHALRESLSEARKAEIELLQSVPDVGMITAMVLSAELMNIERFSNQEQLNSYVGLIPSSRSSGERQWHGRMTHRANNHVRRVLIEAAWMAIRYDPSLMRCYYGLRQRMKENKAIVRIAKKLLCRIRWVWQHQQPYQLAMP